MSIADPPVPAVAGPTNLEDLLALEDGVERDIINGEVMERPMTRRNQWHGLTESWIAHLLWGWLETLPSPRGKIYSGEIGFRLSNVPVTNLGVDVAYASAELVAATPKRASFFDGPPVLAVEILSTSDRHEDVVKKVGLYLEAGTVVWVVDPDFRTMTVHRPGEPTRALDVSHELTGDPELPGFRVRVADVFPA